MKLAITLHYVATRKLSQPGINSFHVPHNTISRFVPKVVQAIVEYFGETLHNPSTPHGWQMKWQFDCVFYGIIIAVGQCGAIDSKHVAIKSPMNTGTRCYNYKGK